VLASRLFDPGDCQPASTHAHGQYGSTRIVDYHGRRMCLKEVHPWRYGDDILENCEQVVNAALMAVREVLCLHRCQHPAVVSFLGWGINPPDRDRAIAILTEYMEGGDLTTINHNRLDTVEFAIIVYGIARGMQHLHARHVIHRDLKPANVFLDDNGRPVIGDFGFAKLASNCILSMEIGTPDYSAPELRAMPVLMEAPDPYRSAIFIYDTSVDVFSYGKLVRELQACPAGQDLCTKCPDFALFVRRCVDANPAIRPQFGEIVDFIENSVFPLLPGNRALEYKMFLDENPAVGENDEVWKRILGKMSPIWDLYYDLPDLPHEVEDLDLSLYLAHTLGILVCEADDKDTKDQIAEMVKQLWDKGRFLTGKELERIVKSATG
jgi:serine/threonine protein kinase